MSNDGDDYDAGQQSADLEVEHVVADGKKKKKSMSMK